MEMMQVGSHVVDLPAATCFSPFPFPAFAVSKADLRGCERGEGA